MGLVVPCGLLATFGGFLPTDIAGCVLWLESWDASTLYDSTSGGSLVSVGGAVARWEDKSGNANHATQSSATRRPTRQASVVNGLDALDFDGSDDQLIHPVNNSGGTLIVAYRLQTLQSGYRGIAAFGPNSTAGVLLLSNVGTTGKWGSFGSGDMTANTNRSTDWVIHTMTDNNAGTCQFYLNGVSDGTVSQNALGQSEKHIGGLTTQESDASVAAVIIYDTVLGSGDLTSVHNYLKSNLGIA